MLLSDDRLKKRCTRAKRNTGLFSNGTRRAVISQLPMDAFRPAILPFYGCSDSPVSKKSKELTSRNCTRLVLRDKTLCDSSKSWAASRTMKGNTDGKTGDPCL